MPRTYGITNAAPYASAPAVGAAGDTYWDTTGKVLYVSDGTAWVAAGPGTGGPPTGAAGGSLAGSTYPNPTIAANAVTLAMLAPAATLKNLVQANIPNNFTSVTTGAWLTLTRSGSITTRASWCLCSVVFSGTISVNPTGGTMYFAIFRDNETISVHQARYDVQSPVTANTKMCPPTLVSWDAPGAGSHNWSAMVWQGTNTVYVTANDAASVGHIRIMEFA